MHPSLLNASTFIIYTSLVYLIIGHPLMCALLLLLQPQLPPQLTEIPRSTFNFDFEYERKILAEAEKENPNWSKFVIESQPPPPPQPPRGPKLTTPTTSVVIIST